MLPLTFIWAPQPEPEYPASITLLPVNVTGSLMVSVEVVLVALIVPLSVIEPP